METYFGALVQYPTDLGSIERLQGFISNVQDTGGYVVMATDLLALTLLKSPEVGRRRGGRCPDWSVPFGIWQPHAAL